jgi:hypothetical protein
VKIFDSGEFVVMKREGQEGEPHFVAEPLKPDCGSPHSQNII